MHPDSEAGWLEQAMNDMDVPSVDGPNTWLVSRATRATGIKVACSGIGGDELFHGYPTFKLIPRLGRLHLNRVLPLIPLSVRLRLERLIPPVPRWSRMAEAVLAGGSVAALWYAYRSLMSDREVADLLVESAVDVGHWQHLRRVENLACPKGLSVERQVSFYEISVYMHDQLLRDADQMSMAHALEIRVPLIGRKVVEAVSTLGHEALAGDMSKMVLRRILMGYLPSDPFRRPKQTFALNWDRLLVRKSEQSRPLGSAFFRQAPMDRLQRQFQRRKSSFGPIFAMQAIETCSRDLSSPVR